jgi:Ca-activated chloride channel homolog
MKITLKYKILIFLIVFWSVIGVIYTLKSGKMYFEVEQQNMLKNKSKQTFEINKNYALASQYLYQLAHSDSSVANKGANYLNLAHCYFLLKNLGLATYYYDSTALVGNTYVKSIAYLQLGNLLFLQNSENVETSLLYYQAAMLENPFNEQARYNYELLRRKFPEATPENPPEQDSEKPTNSNNQNKEKNTTSDNKQKGQGDKTQDGKGNKGGSSGDKNETNSQNTNGNSDKAGNIPTETILEALKRNELQYFQQRKKGEKPQKQKQPDW